MTGLERTTDFLAGKVVDRRPFHPIIIRWAARYAGIKYRDFCTDYPAKCEAMIRCADDFDLDWVTVMSDAYCEASAFGLQIEYPEDSLPIDAGGHLPDLAAVARLMPIKPQEHLRCVIACTQAENSRKPGVKLGGKRKAAGAARAAEAGGGLCRG
jgi:uroporphyrinogen-III decarboxylase